MRFTSQMLRDEPDMYQKAVDHVTNICGQMQIHKPCCRFWEWSDGEPPAATAYRGSSSKLGDVAGRTAAMASIEEEVQNSLEKYQTSVFTPPTRQAGKSAVGVSPGTADPSVQPKQLEYE
jgi:hypothetical protein